MRSATTRLGSPVLGGLVLSGLVWLVATPAAQAQAWNDNGTGIAISGYDVVAYFTDHAAVRGSAEHSASYGGATWHFASEEHRAAFVERPSRYLPQYNGYCAFAAADGRVARVDPTAFTVFRGRLYLNYSHDIQRQWLANRDEFIRQADERWPSVRPH